MLHYTTRYAPGFIAQPASPPHAGKYSLRIHACLPAQAWKNAQDATVTKIMAIKGLEKDHYEIYPGLSGVLKIMSRLAPGFMLKQTSKPGAQFMSGK